MSTKETILYLRGKGYGIAQICKLTGESVTFICEVIYEQNQKDIANDGLHIGNWDGVF
jgi:hypothetical protein